MLSFALLDVNLINFFFNLNLLLWLLKDTAKINQNEIFEFLDM
jgi:hypothetical protein